MADQLHGQQLSRSGLLELSLSKQYTLRRLNGEMTKVLYQDYVEQLVGITLLH